MRTSRPPPSSPASKPSSPPRSNTARRLSTAWRPISPASSTGNVANHGLIANLPTGCCVEIPCLVDANGMQPTVVGSLPPQCAAINRTNVNVQELAVAAALDENLDHVYHAVMLDPLTGALLTLDQTRRMVDELLVAEAQWLPAFATTSTSRATVSR